MRGDRGPRRAECARWGEAARGRPREDARTRRVGAPVGTPAFEVPEDLAHVVGPASLPLRQARGQQFLITLDELLHRGTCWFQAECLECLHGNLVIGEPRGPNRGEIELAAG